MKVSLVNSASVRVCWNYAFDTFYSNYAGDNVSCSSPGFEALLHLFRRHFLLQSCWWIFLLQSCRWLSLLQLCSLKFLKHLYRWQFVQFLYDNFIIIFQFLLQLCRCHFLQCIMHMTVSIIDWLWLLHDHFYYSYVGDSFN